MNESKSPNFSSEKQKNVDIVLCIDATSSMGPCIDNVRLNAKNFHKVFTDKMKNEYNSNIKALRIQVVVFRDLECDVDALVKSEFFELPQDEALFERYLNNIKPSGGGDYKESGMEALYTAMTTNWKAKRSGDRQVIVLFSDADAIGFGEKYGVTGYPDIVNRSKFLKTWNCALGNYNTLQEPCKRLVMFAPAKSLYAELSKELNRSQAVPVIPHNGMADISFDAIIKLICASVSAI